MRETDTEHIIRIPRRMIFQVRLYTHLSPLQRLKFGMVGNKLITLKGHNDDLLKNIKINPILIKKNTIAFARREASFTNHKYLQMSLSYTLCPGQVLVGMHTYIHHLLLKDIHHFRKLFQHYRINLKSKTK